MFYLINKPIGITSFDVIRRLRKETGIKKMGHIGTLDPLASGLILIATENSTKLLPYLNTSKKSYIFTIELDGKSESLDLGEKIIPIDTSNITTLDTTSLKQKIELETEQIPPKYSALRINGKRAYELARDKIDFDIPKRNITVFNVKILHYSPPTISIQMTISSGGYIRSFAPLIGKWHGVNGGYVSSLHRDAIFLDNVTLTEKLSQHLDNFDKSMFLDEKTLFPHFTHYTINDSILEEKIRNGKKISFNDFREDFFQIFKKNDGQFIILYFPNYSSLLQYKNGQFIIKKNNII